MQPKYKLIIILLIGLLAKTAAAEDVPKKIEFGKVWYTAGSSNGIAQGTFHCELKIYGYKNKTFPLNLWIESPKGISIKLTGNEANCNQQGKHKFKRIINNVIYDRSIWDDFKITKDLTQFDAKKGTHTYYFFFTINDYTTGKNLARSDYGTFQIAYPGPKSSYLAEESTSTRTASSSTTNNANSLVRQWSSGTATYKEYGDGRVVCENHNTCFGCRGSGRCRACGGSGRQYSYAAGTTLCGMCGGTGRCSGCQGKGENIVVTVTKNGSTTAASPNGVMRLPGGGSSSGKSSGSSSTSTSSTNSKITVVRTAVGYHRNGSKMYDLQIVKTSDGNKVRVVGRDTLYNIVNNHDTEYKYCYWNQIQWIYFN